MKLKLTREAYEEAYKQKYLRQETENVLRAENALTELGRGLDYYKFHNDCKKSAIDWIQNETKIALWFYNLISNKYQEFTPEDRKIYILNTAGGGNIGYAKRVFG